MERQAVGAECTEDGVTGLVTNIQHFSVHDGPGIRTLVFLKGCPLRCLWCSNPETQEFHPEIGIVTERCRPGCSACREACPSGALSCGASGTVVPDPGRCRECGPLSGGRPPCTAACPGGALRIYGTRRGVGEILDEVEQDIVFYRHEEGGMTLSGGEALAQPEFALALLREAGRRCIHTALETCGFAPPDVLLEACSLLDSLLFDVKMADESRHERTTGVSNARILENLRLVRASFPGLPILVRTPVIPGINATCTDVRALGAYLKELGNIRWELLPYHAYGAAKYASLGRTCREFSVPDEACMKRLKNTARNFARVVNAEECPEPALEPFIA